MQVVFQAVEIARLAGTVPRSTLKAGRRLEGAQRRKRLEIAMNKKKSLLEKLSAKSNRLDVAARKKEICILTHRFRKLSIEKHNCNEKDPEPTQQVKEFEHLDFVDQEIEATGYMLGGISLEKDLVQTAVSEMSMVPTHSAQLKLFNKISIKQQQLAYEKSETCRCYHVDQKKPGLTDGMRVPGDMLAWEKEAHSWLEGYKFNGNKDQQRSTNFDFGKELLEHLRL